MRAVAHLLLGFCVRFWDSRVLQTNRPSGFPLTAKPEPWSFAGLTSGDGAEDEQRLLSRDDRFRQRSVRRFVGEILFACKEAQERSPLLGDVVADGSCQHGKSGLQRIKHRANGDLTGNFDRHFAACSRQRPQMRRKDDANLCCGQNGHVSVCTSTDKTAGRSRTMGAQLSPASAEQQNWPQVLPK